MYSITVGQETIPVRPNPEHVYLIETALVAKGYGVTPELIRRHKKDHADELVEGKHWVVSKTHTLGGRQSATFWTKRGVVRLGFFIKSERAKLFRDAAEDLIIAAASRELPLNYPDALRAVAELNEKVATIAEAIALILPRVEFGAKSKATGLPRTKLIPAYFRTGRIDGVTRHFLTAERQMDLGFFTPHWRCRMTIRFPLTRERTGRRTGPRYRLVIDRTGLTGSADCAARMIGLAMMYRDQRHSAVSPERRAQAVRIARLGMRIQSLWARVFVQQISQHDPRLDQVSTARERAVREYCYAGEGRAA